MAAQEKDATGLRGQPPRLECLIRQLHAELTEHILEHGRRLEYVASVQQRMLDHCMKHVGVPDHSAAKTIHSEQRSNSSTARPPMSQERVATAHVQQLISDHCTKHVGIPDASAVQTVHDEHWSDSFDVRPHISPETRQAAPLIVSLAACNVASPIALPSAKASGSERQGDPATNGQVGRKEPALHRMRSLQLATEEDTKISNAKPIRFRIETIGVSACVLSPRFDYLLGAIVLSNAVFVCVQADFTARNLFQDPPGAFSVVETLYFGIFFMECVLRLYALRRKFFFGPDNRWNMFDVLVLLPSGVQEVFKYSDSTSTNSNLTFLRIMRIVKLSRMLKIIRVVKIFRELRIMMLSIISTLRTLFWSLVCLAMIMSVFGVYFVTVVADYQTQQGVDDGMNKYFGSMPSVMLTLFSTTTGGVNWQDLTEMLQAISLLSCLVFLIFVSLMYFAILNILTGICVNAAQQASDDDFENVLHEEHKKNNSVISNLLRIFRASDTERTGMLTWSQVQQHLKDPQTRGYFKKIDLEPWHLRSFFELLHADGDDEPSIAIEPFVRGCLRLRCSVKNIDLMASRHEEEEMLSRYISKIQQSLDQLHMLMSENDPSKHTAEFQDSEDMRLAVLHRDGRIRSLLV